MTAPNGLTVSLLVRVPADVDLYLPPDEPTQTRPARVVRVEVRPSGVVGANDVERVIAELTREATRGVLEVVEASYGQPQ